MNLTKQLCFAVFILATMTMQCDAFLIRNQFHDNSRSDKRTPRLSIYSNGDTSLYSTTSQKPLYDGTNYTFPDTTTPAGIAEMLEVSFVNACMQLQSGYVDVLKLFIAAAMSSYQFGFTIDQIQKALSECPNETANRPLLPEEVELRHTWYSLVYLTLLSIDHSTIKKEPLSDSIPSTIRQKYGGFVDRMVEIHNVDDTATISVEKVIREESDTLNALDLSTVERAILLQSLRVAALTLVVVREALEAGPGGQSPPTPPIEGAYE